MSKKNSYNECLQQELGSLIAKLGLSELQKKSINSRWLDQVIWMEGKAAGTQRRYYVLRLLTIIGGVILPTIVSMNTGSIIPADVATVLSIVIGLVVAISTAVEGFLHFGDRWRHYRSTVELLKIEGWLLFQLSGQYQSFRNHSQAYPAFAARVEDILRSDVRAFVTEVVKEKEKEK